MSTSTKIHYTHKSHESQPPWFSQLPKLPIYAPRGDGCSCGAHDCDSPGKHPITPWGQASCERERILEWLDRFPGCNWGVLLRPGCGVAVLDIDPRNGGEETLARLGLTLPPTPTVLTGGGGRHYYFTAPDHINTNVTLGPGVELKVNGVVVIPPSLHASGKEYVWKPDAGLEVPLASLPDKLIPLATGHRGRPPIPEGERNTTLTSIAGRLRYQGWGRDEIEAELKRINAERCEPPLQDAEVAQIAKSISKYPTGNGRAEVATIQPTGELAHCLALKPLFQDKYRWHLGRKCWMVYEGGVWRPTSEELVLRQAASMLFQEYTLALSTLGADPLGGGREEVKALLTAVREACSERKVAGALTFLKGEEGIATRPEEWDRDPWLLNVTNGTIDLRSGLLRPHRPEDLLTKQAPVAYDPDAALPLWDKFLEDATGGDVLFKSYLHRVVGYMLTGDTSEEALFLILGPANTGKSTFVEAIKATLGDYAVTSDFETFLARRNVGGPRNDIARLAGARAVFATEVEAGRQLAGSLIKVLTGGDTVAARFLYRESFEFVPTFKLVLTANEAPRIAPDDTALWRRIIRVPFEAVVPEGKRDPQVKARLRDPAHAGAAILSWAVQGCLKWQLSGLVPPDRVRDATRALRLEMNPLRDFIAECCILDEAGHTEAAKLRAVYERWAEGNREKTLSTKAVGKYLKAVGCSREVIWEGERAIRVWRGIALK